MYIVFRVHLELKSNNYALSLIIFQCLTKHEKLEKKSL